MGVTSELLRVCPSGVLSEIEEHGDHVLMRGHDVHRGPIGPGGFVPSSVFTDAIFVAAIMGRAGMLVTKVVDYEDFDGIASRRTDRGRRCLRLHFKPTLEEE